ncbi:hypothetical protein DICVIV_02849 [Dictyocaulus viviparus]|uniref:Uncharacterized protein n=1 Tax=Dictyocaulus viviparus TaxID=29172 RepID=A0A0D8Y8T1_DICVI|nr:hypothetical protein DICVIV_02849 [Dictyocaulus viviparus]
MTNTSIDPFHSFECGAQKSSTRFFLAQFSFMVVVFCVHGDIDAAHSVNLKSLMPTFSPKIPLSIGHQFKRFGEHSIYHSGGAGYILNREAVKRCPLMEYYTMFGFARDAYCNQKTNHEDLSMGRCLYSLGVKSIDGADENGAYRFHPIAIWDLLHNNVPEWLLDRSTTRMNATLTHEKLREVEYRFSKKKILLRELTVPLPGKKKKEKKREIIIMSDNFVHIYEKVSMRNN